MVISAISVDSMKNIEIINQRIRAAGQLLLMIFIIMGNCSQAIAEAVSYEYILPKSNIADGYFAGAWRNNWDGLELEDLLIQWDKSGARPLSADEKGLLPYLIYVDMRDAIRGLAPFDPVIVHDSSTSKKRIDLNGIKERFNKAANLRSLIITKASSDYQAKYGLFPSTSIAANQISEYEKRAQRGDLEAMFELRRYYENPAIGDEYDPEQAIARYWSLAAIKAGSKEAMFDLGYDEPYIAETVLFPERLTATMHVACDKLHNATQSQSAVAGCFLYSLTIGNQPWTDSLPSDQKTYYVYVENFMSEHSLRPQEIAIIEAGRDVFVELTSFANTSDGRLRKDYFGLDGKYMGSDSNDKALNYFYNYKMESLGGSRLAFNSNDIKILKNAVINTLPSFEAFQIQEVIRKKRLHGLDCIFEPPYKELEFASSLDTKEKQTKAVEYYIFKYGDHPSLSKNTTNHHNINKFIDKVIERNPPNGSRFQIMIVKDYWFAEQIMEYYLNPLNDEYDPLKAEHLAFEEDGRMYAVGDDFPQGYINLRKAPYISKTKVWLAGLEVIFLNICSGSADDNGYKSGDNQCFAHHLSLIKNNEVKYHFVLQPFDKFAQLWWSGVSWPRLSLHNNWEGSELIRLTNVPVNNCTGEHCWRIDFFSLSGQYLGSYNRLFSENIVTHYKQINQPVVPDSMEHLSMYMRTVPSWADTQIMKRGRTQ